MRKLTPGEVVFSLRIEPEDIPVRGNALASGDDDTDRDCEDAIISRLDRGDLWAWCTVKVTATWEGLEGVDYLGGCSYTDETQFRQPGGYWEDMQGRALEDLNSQIAALDTKLSVLRVQL